MTTITVETICEGLGHWKVSVFDGVQTVTVMTEWNALQSPLDADELLQFAILVLRTKCVGVPINDLGDLLLNGVSL